jgi:ATP-binding cassette subfamily B protein
VVAGSIALRVTAALVPLAALWIGKQIVDVVVAASKGSPVDHAHVWFLLAAGFVVGVAGAVLSRAIDYFDIRIADQFSRETNLRVMRHAASLDLASIEDPQFQDQLERARLQGSDRIVMLHSLGQLLQQVITLVSLSVSVLVFSPPLFMLMLFAAIPAFLGESHYAFREYTLAYSLTPLRRELDYLRDIGTRKESAKELKVFGLAGFIADRYRDISDEVIGRRQNLAQRRLKAGSLLGIIGTLGYYAAYALLVARALGGSISIGTLTFLVGALAGCSAQIQLVLSSFTCIADQALFLTDLFEFFKVQPRIVNAPGAIPAPRRFQDGFEFRNVSFGYPQSHRLVLRDINLRIPAGETVALVGANGQGKSTIVKLLSRLYDPTGGQILLDGIDLREYDLASLHSQIGVIFQDFMRYDMTARDNIAVGRVALRKDEDLILAAARESGAGEVIERFHDGLEQMLGRRFSEGVDLSGGEWQKFALARAYLRDAQLLILDEPTASLDAISEHEVFARFAELTRGKTALLISHRLSTVCMSDRIVVLHDGVIHEEGTHRQLMARRRNYARMFELQASRYRIPEEELAG